ncbi:chromodomain Y-like protein [Lampris incognitus]|uniref:chromodomain Y-like protein n=1 Tax=Lampris incognitus TaxID=2546036 RepID=UPI0024B507AC|nr:chromodomain Y-like protein [Lampris incognitus]
MAAEELYEVERIVDRRKNKKGKVEYLVRWRGYGTEEDTWEPESNLSSCLVYIQEFNRQREGTLLRSTRRSPNTAQSHSTSSNARKHISRLQPPSGNPSDHSSSVSGNTGQMTHSPLPSPVTTAFLAAVRQNQQTMLADHRGPDAKTDSQQTDHFSPRSTMGLIPSSLAGTARRSVDLAKTGIKILVPKSPMNSRVDSEESPSEAAHSLEPGGLEGDVVPPEVALLEKPAGLSLGPGQERARMGTRPRVHSLSPMPLPQVPITPAAMRSLNSTGSSALIEAVGASGMASLQSASAGKRRLEERSAFDKRLRFSVRQTESAYRYRDIVVKKQDGFTHILLSTKTSDNNALNPEVMKEIQSAMATAGSDDSKVVLLSAVGGVFCYGLDFLYFIRRLTEDKKKESIKMAETIRTFVNTFIQFKKPIVVAVNGPAVGLGAAILPLCDVVWANEKAWFQTPYTIYGQTPDACSSLTFPRIMGVASANEMLLSGRKLTAQEACSKGLVSQVLWPGTFTQEVMLRIKELVSVNSAVLRESKALMRNTSRSALEQANERECEALKRVWGSSQGTDSILKYLQRKIDEF